MQPLNNRVYSFIWHLMPCPFTGSKMFCTGPNFLCQNKNLFTHCGSYKHKCSQIFGLAQKIWTSKKHFGTCKRTRHNSTMLKNTLKSACNMQRVFQYDHSVIWRVFFNANSYLILSIWIESCLLIISATRSQSKILFWFTTPIE